MNESPDLSALPYHDPKPQGAADFYYVVNSTFQFIRREFGMEGLIRYWRELGSDYMKPVWTRWKAGGLEAMESYWKAFFSVEPESVVKVTRSATEVLLEVETCPAVKHIRADKRTFCPEFCQQCYYMNEAAAQKAGYTVRVTGGNGACRQRFFAAAPHQEPQKIEEILPC